MSDPRTSFDGIHDASGHGQRHSERDGQLRVFLLSLIVAGVVAIGAAVVLNHFETPATVAFSTSEVRL
jgi:hypothetical protein